MEKRREGSFVWGSSNEGLFHMGRVQEQKTKWRMRVQVYIWGWRGWGNIRTDGLRARRQSDGGTKVQQLGGSRRGGQENRNQWENQERGTF